MARSFAITIKDGSTIPMQDGSIIAKDPVRADAKGHAEVVFIVTNTTDRPARALAKAIPLGDTKQEWLSINGEDERDFAPRSDQEFTVSFDAPSEPAGATPAGSTPPTAGAPATPVARKYPFRFDVASPLNPQEDFTRGPVVTVEVMPAPVVKPKSKLWILFVVLGVVLLIGIVVLILVLRNGDTGTDGDESPTPTPVESATATPTATSMPTETPTPTVPVDQAALERHCFDLVQGRIAWNYTGSTTWSPVSIQNLCRGTTNPREPPACFQRVMHGGINYGGGTQWAWGNASNLCAGTNDANATISCFQSKIAQGIAWPQAIAQCKKG